MATVLNFSAGYVLHSRAYGDTSLIIDFFSKEYGRQSLYARGAKANKRGGPRALLNPFIPLVVSAKGRGNLKTLTHIESTGTAFQLKGRALYCAFYLNELIVRLLPEDDAQSALFDYYGEILADLSQHHPDWGDAPLEVRLRSFEWLLLEMVGASFSLTEDIDGKPIEPGAAYGLVQQQGMKRLEAELAGISGAALLALGRGDLADEGHRAELKRFMRGVLRPLLGSKPLTSRTLFN
ncbi:DNA repair protein RecO [Simiduia sp. 21SJ11W-1]|uniref:DNA repair protein RecO n=1 Tax=Simiduia sp. 21SJ11W-1 TaxID=2909669 RepID=UPI0020A0DC53|nr:DNA repair protein RecO [Simiduia sp. 21SJ11W-1]UTA46281.1 DNA repair protein RecO [Simiduia sp. 21SJ11W-1]